MDELISIINKYPNGTQLVLRLSNGVQLEGEIDTIYETDNGLDLDEEGYQEYYACVIEVKGIQSGHVKEIAVGSLIEISMQDPPLEIWLKDGTVIWDNK